MKNSALTILLITSVVLTAFSYAQFNVQAESSSQIIINGLVSHPFNFTSADLQAMPQTTVQATLFCVSAPTTPLEKGNWQGVKLWTLLSQAGISSQATKIAFYASDGFSTDLTIDVAKDANIIVAYTLDGSPLTYGIRLVVPGHYGYKWINLITSIEVVDYDYKGTYESQGYPDDGLLGSLNLPNPTPYIPYPPSITPLPGNSSTTTPIGSPQTSSTIPAGTNSTSPQSSTVPAPVKLEAIGIVALILIGVAVVALVIGGKKMVHRKSNSAIGETALGV